MEKKRRILAAVLTVAVIAAVGIGANYKSLTRAVFNTEEAVHITAGDIENSTLIIGTHLIYLSSLNDEIYNIAMESASQSGQSQIYYKSELGSGGWYDITDASSLSAITAQGVRVEDAVIETLFMTHHTRSDGITYDLRTNGAVSIFDIYPIYELENMAELEPLKMQYDLLRESGKRTDSDDISLAFLEDFFATDVHTEETDTIDGKMAALQGYYQELCDNDAPSVRTEAVLKVMGKLDSARKAEVCTLVDAALSILMNQLTGAGMEQEEDDGEDEDEDEEQDGYPMNNALLTAGGDSQANLSESLIESQGNMLSEGSTEMTAMEYELSNELISRALNHNYAECDGTVVKLLHLYNIMDSVIASAADEITVLDELMEKAKARYKDSLSRGETEEYIKAVANHSSHALLNNIIKSAMAEANVIRNEMQYYIEGKVKRLGEAEARDYVTSLIQNSVEFSQVVVSDDFATELTGSVSDYVAWLNSLLGSLKGDGSAMAGSEMTGLQEQVEALKEERLSALDKNDLDTARQLEAKITHFESRIQQKENALADSLSNLEAEKNQLEQDIRENPDSDTLKARLADADAQIAGISSQLVSDSEAKNIMDMKNTALELIKDGDTSQRALDSVANSMEGIATFLADGSRLALTAEKALYNAMANAVYLDDNAGYQDLMNQLGDIIAESGVTQWSDTMSGDNALAVLEKALGASLTDGLAGGSGDGTGGSGSGAGGSGDGTGDSDMAAALMALGQYASDTGNEEVQKLAQGLASQAGGYVFLRHTSSYGDFAPADVVAKYLGYRYIWNDTKKTAILSKGRNYYSFTAFDWHIGRGGQEDTMEAAAEFDGVVYIPANYLKSEFELTVVNITGTDYSVLVNDKEVTRSQELLSALSEEGGS